MCLITTFVFNLSKWWVKILSLISNHLGALFITSLPFYLHSCLTIFNCSFFILFFPRFVLFCGYQVFLRNNYRCIILPCLLNMSSSSRSDDEVFHTSMDKGSSSDKLIALVFVESPLVENTYQRKCCTFFKECQNL